MILSDCKSPTQKIYEKPNPPALTAGITGDRWVILEYLPVDFASRYNFHVSEKTDNWELINNQHKFDIEYLESEPCLQKARIKNLLPDSCYTFFMTAINNSGKESDRSNEIFIYTRLISPVINKTETLNHYTVKISWNIIPLADYYAVFLNDKPKIPDNPIMWDIEELSAVFNTLSENKTYYFWIIAYNINNYSDFSKTTIVTTQLSAPIAHIDETKTTSNSVLLYWENVTGADSYEVYYILSENEKLNENNWLKEKTKETQCEIKNLKPNKTYAFKVKAFSSLNNKSNFSESVYTQTLMQTSNLIINWDFTNPDDPLLEGMPENIIQVTKDSYTIKVKNDEKVPIENIKWLLNGVEIKNETSDSFIIDWRLTVGSYVITALVTINNIPYSSSAHFHVLNDNKGEL